MIDYFKKKEFVRWFVIFITVLNLASLGTIVYLTWNDHPRPKKRTYDKRHHAFGFLDKKLGLSEEQQKSIKSFMDSHFAVTRELHLEYGKLRQKLYTEMAKPNSDSLMVESAIEKLNVCRSDLERAMAKHFNKMKSVLTDEQKVHFSKLMKRLKKHKKRWSKRNSKDKKPPTNGKE